MPVVGGNVSLYNEAHGRDIDPTPVVATLGTRPMPTSPMPDPRCASGTVVLIDTGETPSLAGSLAAALLGDRRGAFPAIDLKRLAHLLALVQELVVEGTLVSAAHNLGRGGLARGLAWLSAASGHGIVAEPALLNPERLLAEHPSRVLVTTGAPEEVLELARARGLSAEVVGELGGVGVYVGPLQLA